MDFYQRALELNDELIQNRRFFHTNAEVGLRLPKSTEYVIKKLKEYGIEPVRCGEGVTAVVGCGGKVILLRADMDALPIKENSRLPFACPSGEASHGCGHDLHAAMLLIAARMLKEQESSLKGTVKLMFQPGEETLEGCRNMIDSGILDAPSPNAALALHVGAGRLPVGTYLYNDGSTAMMYSSDVFCLTIHGKGAHSAYPHLSVDPINIGVHIHLALQSLVARESAPSSACTLIVGEFTGGTAANSIPETATLNGTLRTDNPELREKLLHRIAEVSTQTAAAFGGTASTELSQSVPPLFCNSDLTKAFTKYIGELPVPGLQGHSGITSGASEDFAQIAEMIPASLIYLSAGFSDERGDAPAHSPNVIFNEDVLPFGAAVFAHCAMRWLENNL